MSDELQILVPAAHGIADMVSFTQLDKQYDETPNVRIYSTQHYTSWNLQIRAAVPLSGKGNHKKVRNLVATAHLNWDDLKKIAAYVMAIQKEMIEGHYDELRSEPEPKTPA